MEESTAVLLGRALERLDRLERQADKADAVSRDLDIVNRKVDENYREILDRLSTHRSEPHGR